MSTASRVAGSHSILRALASTSLLAVVLTVSPISAWAQARTGTELIPASPSPGWYLTPSVSISEEYDDNIFGTSSGQQSDFITRFSPGLQVGFISAPLTLLASTSFASEVFANDPDLTDALSRKGVGVDLEYLPTRLMTLGLSASYVETQDGTELLPETGIELGRRRTTDIVASPSLSYRFTRLTSGDISYSYRHSSISGGVTNITHGAQLTLARQLTPVDTGTVGYGLGFFESEESETTTSHTLTLGWTRRLAKQTTLALRGGSRFSDGAVEPEVGVSLARRFKLATVSLAYARSEAVVIGEPGTVDADSLSGSVAFVPLRSLEVTLAPSFRRSSRDEDGVSSDTMVYGFDAGVAYRLTKQISLRAAYRFSLEEEGGLDDIRRNIISISLDFGTRIRVNGRAE